MNKHLQTILEKPMNRREFLGYIGAAILAVIGVSGMIKNLLQHAESHHPVGTGYGSSSYGGQAGKRSLLG